MKNFILGVILFCVLISSAIIFAILSYIYSLKPIKLFTFILSAVLCAITILCFNAIISKWSIPINKEETYKINGVIETIITNDDGDKRLILKNSTINNNKVDGKIQIEIKSSQMPYDKLLGYKIEFESKIYVQEIIGEYGVNGVAFRKNIRYKAFPPSVTFSYQDLDFRANILNKINNVLKIGMGEQYGSIAYSMLTGDTNNLDNQIVNYFSISGVGHILSVSGLHIGFLVMLLVFIFKKFRVSAKIYVPTILLFLTGYVLLIGSSPSLIRSILMCTVGLLTTINGKRKDALSSIFFSFCVIVSLSPIFLFEVGFIYTFSAVFALILFTSTLEKFFRKIHLPHFIASPLSVSLSAQIGITPAMAYFFNQMQMYSIISNMLLMPLIMFSFLATMILVPFVLLFPAIIPLLRLAGAAFLIIDKTASFLARLPYSSIVIYASIFVFICYPIFFLISRFTMSAKYKKTNSLFLAMLCFAVLFSQSAIIKSNKFSQNNVIMPINSSLGDVTTVCVNDGEINIIGDFKNATAVKNTLYNYNIHKINAIVVFKLTRQVAKQIIKIGYSIKYDAIYFPQSGIVNDGLKELIDGGIKNFYALEQGKINGLNEVPVGNKTGAFLYEFNEKNVLLAGYASNYSKIDKSIVESAHIIRSFSYEDCFEKKVYLTDMDKCYLSLEQPFLQVSTVGYENIIFDVSSGKIIHL